MCAGLESIITKWVQAYEKYVEVVGSCDSLVMNRKEVCVCVCVFAGMGGSVYKRKGLKEIYLCIYIFDTCVLYQ